MISTVSAVRLAKSVHTHWWTNRSLPARPILCHNSSPFSYHIYNNYIICLPPQVQSDDSLFLNFGEINMCSYSQHYTSSSHRCVILAHMLTPGARLIIRLPFSNGENSANPDADEYHIGGLAVFSPLEGGKQSMSSPLLYPGTHRYRL